MRTGVAGWSIPGALAGSFPGEGSHLVRYARRLDAVEINSSFYRPHRRATYERWAASVPPTFRFAVKLPKTISHERRLIDCDEPLKRFADEMGGLGDKRGPLLLQLPPSFVFDTAIVKAFLARLRERIGGSIVCEPRHRSWFVGSVNQFLADEQVSRVASDPALVPAAAEPGGWRQLMYFRLHGTPQTYHSDYANSAIQSHAERVRACTTDAREVWTIFDNTAAGHATGNALALTDALG